jgi:hypothetical protein
MKASLGGVASFALLSGLVLMVVTSPESYYLFAPVALFAVASILGGATHRTQAGKYACYGDLVGIVVWVLRFCAAITGAEISEGMRVMWSGG